MSLCEVVRGGGGGFHLRGGSFNLKMIISEMEFFFGGGGGDYNKEVIILSHVQFFWGDHIKEVHGLINLEMIS